MAQEKSDKGYVDRLVEAAKQGDLESLYTIGALHDTGNLAPLIPEDKEKASEIFEEAADKGHAHSMWIHACELLWGQGVREQSIGKGMLYLDRAIESGSPEACITKARILSTGELGFEQDLKLAVDLRKQAKALDESIVDPFA